MEWKKLFKIVIAFILMLIYNNYYSQNYRAFYTIKYKPDSTENKTENKNMLLDIKGSISRFYSYKLYKSDSTLLANEKIGRETPTKSMDYDFMVIKKKDQNQIEKFYRLQMDIYLLKEQSPKFDWKVTNEIRRIGEFTCQKATAKFKGRIWEAWFTQEIPINEGLIFLMAYRVSLFLYTTLRIIIILI
ncbi:GLPGLI family protein [Chryseobacterium wanjuense]